MGFGGYSFNVLAVVSGITYRALEKFTTEQIFNTGIAVVHLLENFKAKHPEQIPTKPSGGLLDMGPLPLNDFELARHLIAMNDPAICRVIKGAKGVPVLFAYLAVLTKSKELPPDYLLKSALPYAVDSLTVESEVSRLWSEALQSRIERLEPLANTGAKFATGRKPEALGPLAKAVQRHLKDCRDDNPKAVWGALAAHPPKGMTFHDNRHGKYVEFDKRTFKGNLKNSDYRNFANIVYRERKRLLRCID